jgi:PEP-CTERM motif-containing protein
MAPIAGDVGTVATPEPSSISLMLTGTGLLGLVMRKRIAQGFPSVA